MRKQHRPQEKPGLRHCENAGCEGEGEFRAPKTRSEQTEYFWFCLDCVREYNKKWDYFAGMGPDEIEEFRNSATHGHRPTWNMHISPQQASEQLRSRLNCLFGDGFIRQPDPRHHLPNKTRKAMETLELEEYPVTLASIKSQYKKLVKRYHPDLNRNDPACEERFKQVTEAYSQLLSQYQERANG